MRPTLPGVLLLGLWAAVPTAWATGSGLGLALTRQRALEESWDSELGRQEPKKVLYKNPVRRVINLLEKMKAELAAEATSDAKMYDKMVCWCESNEKEKTEAIAAAESKEAELESEIETGSARFGELSTNIEAMKGQIAEDTANLKEATAIREKEAAAFRSEETDLTQAIANLRNAISVLSKHQGGSLLQLGPSLVSGLRVTLRATALKYEMLIAGGRRQNTMRHGGRHGGQENILLALGATKRRVEAHQAESPLSRALLGALDPDGASIPDHLPLRFAERVLARSASRSGSPQGASAFLQMTHKQPNANAGSYNSASGQIFGIMEQMMEEFQAELAQSQADEKKALGDFEAMSSAKAATIEAGKKKLDELEGEHAANQKAVEDAKEDLELTRTERSENIKFLQNLKVTCLDLDAQFEERTKTRGQETTAVAEAIKVLTEDDNREMAMSSTSFIQMQAMTRTASRARALRAAASAALRKAAASADFGDDDLLSSWQDQTDITGKAPIKPTDAIYAGAAAGPRRQLSNLAVRVQLDSFTKVKEAMDEMIANLKKEQTEEVEFKSYCVGEFDKNEKATFKKKVQKKDLEATISELDAHLATLESEIGEAKAQIANTGVEIKKASQNREAENKVFQELVADQRATQTILKKALLKLKGFYKKASLLQQKSEGRAQQTPPAQFTSYKSNAGASGVMGLIEQIVEDSKKLEAESTAAEQKAQAEYEALVADSNALIKELTEAVVSKTKAAATAKEDAAAAGSGLEFTSAELTDLGEYEADLHGQCDFVLKNFDVRQKARLQEMEAIQAAKAILSGAK